MPSSSAAFCAAFISSSPIMSTTVSMTSGTYFLQSDANFFIASNDFSPNDGRVTLRYSSFVPAFRLIETISTAFSSLCAVGSLCIRSERPFVFSLIFGPPFFLMYFAVSTRTSRRSVGSPYPQNTTSLYFL